MTVITGLLIQSEFATSETVANIEVIIDSAIDTVNSDAGINISYMTGASPTKTITVTGDQAAAIKPLVAIKLASNKVAGGSSQSYGVGSLSTSSSTNVGASNSNSVMYDNAIRRLRIRRTMRT
jgi:hypothetical protein